MEENDIIVTGDFNQWDLARTLENFPNLVEQLAGPTWGQHVLDRTYTNFEDVKDVGLLLPLHTDDNSKKSDHSVCYVRARIPRKDTYKWLSYSYRYNNLDSTRIFGEWIVAKDWSAVLQAAGPNRKMELYQEEIAYAIDNFFR